MADATAAALMPGPGRDRRGRCAATALQVLPLTTRDPRRLLDEGAIDVAVGFFPAVVADLTAQVRASGVAAFDRQRLYEGRYVCVMRREHPLAGQPLTLDAFCGAHHLLVSFSGRPYGFIDEALAALGRSARWC